MRFAPNGVNIDEMEGHENRRIDERKTGFRFRMPKLGFGGGPPSLRNDIDKEFQNGVNVDGMKGHENRQVGERQTGFRLRTPRFRLDSPPNLQNDINKEFQNDVNIDGMKGHGNEQIGERQVGFRLKTLKFRHRQHHNNKAHNLGSRSLHSHKISQIT